MVCLVLVSAFLVLADENDTDVNATDENKTVGPGSQKNMTYWQCVSDAAKVKNECYTVAKNATDAKRGKKDCKTAFKAVKGECNKMKHTYWQGFKALFL